MTTTDLSLAEVEPLGPRLGMGGEAMVLEAGALTLPETDSELVYKSYWRPRPVDLHLADLVAARLALGDSERARLDALTTWPLRRVVDGDAVHGVVLRRIPPEFVRTMVAPGTGETVSGPRDAQGLMYVEPAGSRALGTPEPPELVARLGVCRDLSATLALLHERLGIVYGDLSAKNVLVRFDERPRVLLLDCDAARPSSSDAAALHTPDWEPPEDGPATTASDVYKLGLFVLRALAPVPWSAQNRDPSWAIDGLDADGFDLLRRSLHQEPDRRPRAADWFVHLSRVLGEPVVPPRFQGCGLSVTVVAPGDTTTVLWRLDEPAEVTVTSHGTILGTVRADAGPGRLEVTPTASGAIRLRARNATGEHDTAAGAVMVLSPQPTADLPVPAPSFPTCELPPAPATPLVALPPAVYGSMVTAFPALPEFWPARPATGSAPTPDLPGVPWWLVDPAAVLRRTPTRREARR